MTGAADGAPERVLLVAPTGRDAALASAALRAAGIEVATSDDLAQVVAELGRGAGTLLLAQEAIEAGGARLLSEWIAGQPPWSDLPVVVFTSAWSPLDPAAALDRLAPLGNVTLLERPLRRATFVTVVRSAIRARHRQYAARDVLVALEREITARDQFLAMLGHELRNPLSAIMMALQVVELRSPGGARELDIVVRQSRQLARIVDDLLDVARVTSGKIALHRVLVDLSTLVAKGVEAYQPQAARSGVALASSLAPPGLTVLGDPVRLEQVLANVVGNALKYTPRGGHVSVALDRSRGGLGLGLTVARSLVAMHGGTIEAFSEGAGQGSEFVVRLPLAAGAAEQPAGAPDASPRRGRRVLVVEDGDDNRAALKAALQQMGHDVLDAADGITGAERAIRHAPEVVVVDIGLPGLDGYEVARRIRAALGDGVLLVALTGYGQPDDQRSALAAGFDVHLTKPVELETLAAIIGRAR